MNRDHPYPEIIELLLNTEPNVTNITTSNGNTCLHWFLSQQYPRNETDITILEKIYFSNPSAAFIRNDLIDCLFY